ncbi:MAG: copper resistance protein B [Pseudomonadales bacterium]
MIRLTRALLLTLLLLGLCLVASLTQAQNAADDYYDPVEMAKAREAVKAAHGAQWHNLILGERFELQSNEGDELAVWEGQGWLGGDIRRLWFKTEGEYDSDAEGFEEAEVQMLYSQAISPFWDLQAGIRYDLDPNPSRSYAVVGAQGLAPYWFELDGSLFLSNKGDLSARVEAEYEIRFSQRLILQPRLELNAAFSDDEAIGVASGLSSLATGLRLRYELRRAFAPYIGVSWSQALGDTRKLRRADAEASDQLSFVAGIRFWF